MSVAAIEIIQELGDTDVKLTVDGEELVVSGPSENVTPELTERLRAHKAELIRVLRLLDRGAVIWHVKAPDDDRQSDALM